MSLDSVAPQWMERIRSAVEGARVALVHPHHHLTDTHLLPPSVSPSPLASCTFLLSSSRGPPWSGWVTWRDECPCCACPGPSLAPAG